MCQESSPAKTVKQNLILFPRSVGMATAESLFGEGTRDIAGYGLGAVSARQASGVTQYHHHRRAVLLGFCAVAAVAAVLATLRADSASRSAAELYATNYEVGTSADLDAPTAHDVARESFWGYLDPDSPTPHELSSEVLYSSAYSASPSSFNSSYSV